MKTISITCPICFQPLENTGVILKCINHHAFDLSREGYTNLLNSHSSKQKGDDKAMIQARQQFLEAGYYQPLSNHLNKLVDNLLSSNGESQHPVVDAGCGNGYYLDRLETHLTSNGIDTDCIGFDISKWAVRKGAILNKTCRWFVADAKQPLLFQSETVSLLLNIFAPRQPLEFARVLKQGHWVISVIPSEAHLTTLRGMLKVMDIEAEKYSQTIKQFSPHFKHSDTIKVEHVLSIDTLDHLVQLVQMTPFSVHMNGEKWQLIESLSSFKDIFSCQILLFEKA